MMSSSPGRQAGKGGLSPAPGDLSSWHCLSASQPDLFETVKSEPKVWVLVPVLTLCCAVLIGDFPSLSSMFPSIKEKTLYWMLMERH